MLNNPKESWAEEPGSELCWDNGPGPVVLTLGKADLYLPWRPLSVFHCVFAGAVRTAWGISQVQGVEGPPTSFQAHLALHSGLEGGIHHCRVNSLGHISAMKQDSCIKQSPPGSPPHTSSLPQVPLHNSTGCSVGSSGGPCSWLSHTGAQPKTWGWLGEPSSRLSTMVMSKATGTLETQSPGHPSSGAPVISPSSPLLGHNLPSSGHCHLPNCCLSSPFLKPSDAAPPQGGLLLFCPASFPTLSPSLPPNFSSHRDLLVFIHMLFLRSGMCFPPGCLPSFSSLTPTAHDSSS